VRAVKSAQPLDYLWWLASRASGIVALVLISVTVMFGLAMAAKAVRPPSLKRAVIRLHEHLAITALAAIAVHGLSLLGDHWLNPGWRGITIPFELSYRRGFTAAGIIAGYMVLLLGPSFYVRRRIGVRRWRALHRGTALAWMLSAIHALGAGSDGNAVLLRVVVLSPMPAIAYLLVLRLASSKARNRRERQPREPYDHAPAPAGARAP
jgi:methionine sulfoxide reductase heme-binding subunit